MQKDNINTLQHFIKLEQQRTIVTIKGPIEAQMDYMQYAIRSQFDKNSKQLYKFKKRKEQLEQQFMIAINEMSREEKVKYYQKFIEIIRKVVNNQQPPKIIKQVLTEEGFTRSVNLKMWKKKKIRLDQETQMLYIQKSTKITHFNLANYLVRQSKNKDYFTLVLEAVNSFPHESSRRVHLGFIQIKIYNIWFRAISQAIYFKNWEFVKKALTTDSFTINKPNVDKKESRFLQSPQSLGRNPQSNNSSPQKNNSNFSRKEGTSKLQDSSDDEQLDRNRVQIIQKNESHHINNATKFQTIIDSILEDNQEMQQILETQRSSPSPKHKNLDIFHKIVPEYQLEDLPQDYNYDTVLQQFQGMFRVIQHRTLTKQFKVYMSFPPNISKELIFSAITNTDFILRSNPAIEQLTIKTMIASENSAIIYQRNKAYNKLYRGRDFIYLRHAFSNDGDLYLIDRSLDNSNYPPFITIVRGQLRILWGVLSRDGQTKLIIDIQIQNQGYLNELQQANLTMMLIEGFKNLSKDINKQRDNLLKWKIFDLGWDITKGQKKQGKVQTRRRRKSSSNSITSDKFKHQQEEISFRKTVSSKVNMSHQRLEEMKVMEQVGEIDLEQLERRQKQKTVQTIIRQVDAEGYVVISQDYINTSHRISPINPKPQHVYQQPIVDHPIWRGEWQHDSQQGGMIFTNYKKTQSQKGVLKFILTKMGKNLLSGKGIMNISLPVDIFGSESNLEKLVYSLTYAPLLLQEACQMNLVDRLKRAVVFGITNSPLYLSMEKPFNPILGQTFQCWINGCPAYAEQISHHPPIAALLMMGRGYRISAQVESKIQVGLNNGCGCNDGIYRIRFDDGIEICFGTGGGELSGLVYGVRKFNIIGKSYYWIQKGNLMVEVWFNPGKKGFFSVGKQQTPVDYFEGEIYEVKPQFMKSFVNKRRLPSQKDIVRKLGKISGVWNKCYKFNDDQQLLLDINKEYPLMMEYEMHPLPSDSNWREDIHYRRVLEITRAQTQKQRLEVLQRNDRKLREKGNKKK